MWLQALDIHNSNILQNIKKFSLENFAKLQKSPAFRALPYDLLIDYITDNDLRVRNDEERLGAALNWIRADSEQRAAKLIHLLDALPLANMGMWFLDHLLSDPLIQSLPQAIKRINRAQEEVPVVTDADRQKGDITAGSAASQPLRDRSLVFVAAEINGELNYEVKAIKLDQNLEVVSMGSIEACMCRSNTNFCVVDDSLYLCGVGSNREEVWQYNLTNRTSNLITR